VLAKLGSPFMPEYTNYHHMKYFFFITVKLSFEEDVVKENFHERKFLLPVPFP